MVGGASRPALPKEPPLLVILNALATGVPGKFLGQWSHLKHTFDTYCFGTTTNDDDVTILRR